mmetsp:Transcript_71658/g.159369  ORF Transcript_71658/g.159369 Transcript_71658/m.159369 type:complete len:214 (-) Transcript_71658:145-786(-)
MVRVVRSYSEYGHVGEGYAEKGAVEARVVEGGEAATGDKEEDARGGVYAQHITRHEEDRKHVHVLTSEKLEGMDVDCICVATRGHNLPVVVLMHVCIQLRVVQCAMEGCVEGVVHDEEQGQRQESVAQSSIFELPEHICAACHELQIVEGHHDNEDLARGNELPIPSGENCERLATSWQVLPACEGVGHSVLVKLQAHLREAAKHHQLDSSPL